WQSKHLVVHKGSSLPSWSPWGILDHLYKLACFPASPEGSQEPGLIADHLEHSLIRLPVSPVVHLDQPSTMRLCTLALCLVVTMMVGLKPAGALPWPDADPAPAPGPAADPAPAPDAIADPAANPSPGAAADPLPHWHHHHRHHGWGGGWGGGGCCYGR
ncbi:hypothetical protein OTU49_000158, partial [Cherax quadricarinatus]